nr:unnamed protein product [Digitaria exilis]
MGLPTETGGCAGTSSSSAPASRQQPCGGVGNGNKELAADAVGFRTPQRRVASAAAGGDDDELTIRVPVCPPAPRKRRRTPASAPAAVVRRPTEFYAGADLEAFFAAHYV